MRALFEEAAGGAFGARADEQLLRAVRRRGYLDRGTRHESLAHDLHFSRATYFRRLRRQRTAWRMPCSHVSAQPET